MPRKFEEFSAKLEAAVSNDTTRQNELLEEMERELLIIERTYLSSGLCISNVISILADRAEALRQQEQKELAAMQAEDEGPIVDENEEHRLYLKQLI